MSLFQVAVIQGEVGEETSFFVGAIGLDKGALVFGMMYETTLSWYMC